MEFKTWYLEGVKEYLFEQMFGDAVQLCILL